jgi:hypothetical protein
MSNRSIVMFPAAAFVVVALGACTSHSSDSGAGATPQTAASEQVAVSITGGHETNPVDNGRPVVLVASLLGVEPQVFRTAFSGVTPAAAGTEPEGDQVQLNKQTLLSVLSPYGVTNELLDAASNDYRYAASAGETWAQRDAVATAAVVDGAVTGITITDPGRGYTSAPTIAVVLPDGTTVSGTATVTYTTDFETNGSITAVALD